MVVTKSEDISYAGCGLPYYIGGDIQTRSELIVNTPAAYEGLTGVNVRTGVEAVALDAAAHEVTVREKDGSEHGEKYDKLVIATGASPIVPALTCPASSPCARPTTPRPSATTPTPGRVAR